MIELVRQIYELISNPLFDTLFPFIFLAFWIYISFSSARKSGWKKLKEKFKYNKKKPKQDIQFCMGTGEFADINYSYLRIGLCIEGLIIKQYMNIYLFHPPLFFPWTEISNIKLSEQKKSLFNLFNHDIRVKITKNKLLGQYAEINFRDHHGIKIEIPWQKTYQSLLPKSLMIIGNI